MNQMLEELGKHRVLRALSIVHLLDKPIQKIINGVKCWILLVEKVTGKIDTLQQC
jgi:hypothetical protein